LGRRLSEGLSSDLLNQWIGDDAERQSYLAGSVFGTIRWNKVRGRPKAAPLASGFEIHHQAWWFRTFAVPGYPTFEQKWRDIVDVFTYDLPDEGDDHRVGFTCTAVPQRLALGYTGDNRVSAYPVSGQAWESVELTPQGYPAPGLTAGVGWGQGFKAPTGFLVLGDFVFD
jgi:hypothetical protein